MNALCLQWPAVGSQTGRGIGNEAEVVASMARKARKRFYETVSLGDAQQQALDKLYSLFAECSKPNWDGYGALAVAFETYVLAKQFIESVPTILPAPDVSVEPDGEVSFEWYESPRRVFAVSVGSNNNLTYAGLFAANKAHGVETFHDVIPPVILQYIRRVCS